MRLDEEAARIVAEDLAPGIAFAPFADRLEPVVDALVEERPVSRVEKVARTAAAAVWQEGLRAAAEAELGGLEAETRETLARLEAARAELSRPVTDNRLAYALVEELCLSQLDAVVAMGMRLEELEEELREASPDERREIALRMIAELGPLEASAEDGRAAASAMLEATASGTDADELLMQATRHCHGVWPRTSADARRASHSASWPR